MTNMIRTGVFFASVLLSAVVPAQSNGANDSTRYIFPGERRVTGMGGLMLHCGSLGFNNEVFTSAGGGGGILIDQRLMVGAYGQGLTNAFIQQDFTENGRTEQATLTFGHGGLWLLYSFAPKEPVHMFASFQTGWGSAQWVFKDEHDEDEGYVPDSLRTPDTKEDRVVVFTPSVGVEFNVLRWFRPNVYIGYRSVAGLSLPGMGSKDLDGFIAGASLLFGGFGERRK